MIGLIIVLIIVIIFMYAGFTYLTPRYIQAQRILKSREMWLVSGIGKPSFYLRFGDFTNSQADLLPTGTVRVTRYNSDKMFESESELEWFRREEVLVVGGYHFILENIFSLTPRVIISGNVGTMDAWKTTLADA